MQLSEVMQRLEKVVSITGSPDAGPSDLKAALQATSEVRSYVDAQRAELVQALASFPTAFPEATIADTSGCSLGAATKEKERATTLGHATAVADALSDGAISAEHVDALTRATRNLDEAGTSALLGDDEAIADAASTRNIAEFAAWIKRKAKQHDTGDAEDRLQQQRRAARVRAWTDNDGMYNLKGRFDPVVGKDLAKRIDAVMRSKFAEQLPDTAPSDPIERTQHLQALAVADLLTGAEPGRAAAGPPLVVIDASQTNGAGEPIIDWGIPVELPMRVLTDVLGANDPHAVIVANGVVLHAPGRLDLGRSTRLANRAQRRALNGLYSTCAVPGCAVHYDRCRLHHVVYWRNGGRTDLDNLLPVCQQHHTLIHNNAWAITLGSNRELAITLPDGQVLSTGPPKRSAA